MPEVRRKDKEHQWLHSLCQIRDKLVKQRKQLKNKINNVMAGYGVLLKREELAFENTLKQVREFDNDPMVNLEMSVLVEQIRSLNANIKKA